MRGGATGGVRRAASTAGGGARAASDAPALVAAAAVTNHTPPPTISGTPAVGQTLTANKGAWTGTAPISYSYQWRRCDKNGGSCSSISGATNPTYTIQPLGAGTTLRIPVTATNTIGPTSATPFPTSVRAPAVPPRPAPGTPPMAR